MSSLEGRNILVTGGTGSFGRAFVRHVLEEHRPERVVVFSRDELKQSEMMGEIADPRMRFFLGDVRDRDRLYRAFDSVDVVVHAAALKQIPATEYNPAEAVKTNVLGAMNIIDAAIDSGVERVIALSTDKAANPINLYGATKLCSDKLFVAGNAYAGRHNTRFSVVRYGNVVGSRGSVIPLFKRLRETGVIPVTDPTMTRFWITLVEGAEFVARSLQRMSGGEVFVPKIPSATIGELAEAIAPDCRVDVVGLRPGEKMHELMISADDARLTIELDDFYVLRPDFPWWSGAQWADGKAVPEGFTYASDTNPWRLSVEELRKMIGL